MRKAVLLAMVLVGSAAAQKYGVGRPPTAEEEKAWDISISPDGKELPPGSGTVAEGKEVYSRRCQRCHGEGGKGGDEAVLVGGKGSLTSAKPLKTVGSYWPYSTTMFDYIRRAMPFKDPGTLTPNQVYAVTAYILNLNGIVGEGDKLDAQSLPKIKMPNKESFIPDPRPDTGKKAKK